MERIQLHYFKRLIGLDKKFNSIVIKGDLGLFSLRNKRLVRMVGYWEKIIAMPDYRLTKNAFNEMLLDKRKDSWPVQIKSILDNCGLSGWWNDGIGPGVETGLIAKAVEKVLQDQEIQVWQEDKVKSQSLGIYRKIKEAWGEEIYLKFGLQNDTLKWVLSVRGNFMPLGGRRKYLGRVKVRSGPFTCPMCGESEDLEHFMCYCEELKVLRREIFGRDVMDRRCLENKIGSSCKVDIKNLGNFVSVGMRHREGFLS